MFARLREWWLRPRLIVPPPQRPALTINRLPSVDTVPSGEALGASPEPRRALPFDPDRVDLSGRIVYRVRREPTEQEQREFRFEAACRAADQMRRRTQMLRNASTYFGLTGSARFYEADGYDVLIVPRAS